MKNRDYELVVVGICWFLLALIVLFCMLLPC